jgi:hypothetical protein
MRDLSLAETGRIKFKLKDEACVVHLKAAQAISVGKIRERTKLGRRESGLQTVSDFDQCHAEIISGAGEKPGRGERCSVDSIAVFL